MRLKRELEQAIMKAEYTLELLREAITGNCNPAIEQDLKDAIDLTIELVGILKEFEG